MLAFVLLILGFVPLVWGAELMVSGASSLAKRLNIPDMVIGLTLVAFGTSAPELVVNVMASSGGAPQIALGNIIGSNIFNILAILGVSALVYPLTVKTATTWIEIPLCLLAALVVMVTASDHALEGLNYSRISRIDGIILLFFFLVFMVYNVRMMLKGRDSGEDGDIAMLSTPRSVLYALAGLLLLLVGGKLIVTNAVLVARMAGVSQRIIAITIVSIGTSLPELATSIAAARRHAVDIAVGNIVGSNLFNTFLILGISAVITPVPVRSGAWWDLAVNIGASLLLFIAMFTGGRGRLDRWEGGLFVALYTGFVVSLVFIR